MLLFGLNHDVVQFGTLRFWAERGLIHIEDSADNSYNTVSVRTILTRAKAISDMLGNSTQREQYSEDQYDSVVRKLNQDMLDSIVVLARKARIQGTPDDPAAVRDLQRRAKRSVIVPSNSSW